MQPTISPEADVFWSLISDGTDAGQQDLSFESFERDIGEIEFDWPFPQLQDNFPIYPDTLPVITTPSSFTYSTESDSQYSYGFAPSDYSIPSDVVTRGPAEHGVYIAHDSIRSDMFDLSSFGSLPPSPVLHPAVAHSDYGTSEFFNGSSPDDLSFTLQQSATFGAPGRLPVQVTPDIQTLVRPFQCPYCPFASKRKYNLKTHIATHDKEKPKQFICSACDRGFSRKHDLRRHRTTQHDDLKSSSSAYSSSTVDSAATSDFPDDLMAYLQGV